MKKLLILTGAAAITLAGAMQARAALKYETGDYAAQDALVMHLDGIRNVGANRAHDSNASTWIDLAGKAGAITLVKRDASDASAWTDKGYFFAGMSYGISGVALPEMTNLTIEAFGDFPADRQRTSATKYQEYANYVSANALGKDFGIYTYNGERNLFWKTDNCGVSSRPSFGSWNSKNVSCVLAADTAKMYENGVEKASQTRSAQTAVPSVKYVLANSGNDEKYLTGNNYTRQAYGTFNAVRIYNRALTADEVAQNAAIDAARFEGVMPVTNAVVATSVAGANGNEFPGVYAVDGSHVFIASPSAKVGSTTYACTGYTIERWENGAWGTPTTVAAYSVTVSESEKVRITWQWAEASGTLDGGYVTDGLVLWYDGIWNAGVGVHDSSAAVWKDLSSSGNDALLSTNGVTTYGTAGWKANGYQFFRNAWFETAAGQSFGDTFTIQTVGDFSQSAPNLCTYPMLFYGSANTSDTLQMYWNNSANSKKVFLLADSFTGNNSSRRPYVTSSWAGRYLTSVLEKNGSGGRDAWMFEGTEYPTDLPGYVAGRTSSKDFSAATKWAVGSIPSTANSGHRSDRLYTGTINAVRVYSRKLSSAEIARNREVDEARFFGGATPANGAVAVRSQFADLSGREPNGCYFPDSWTFSAGSGTARGCTWRCSGYTLEAWDSANGRWGEPASYEGSTYTSPSGTAFPSVRLTWLWSPVSGVRSAADYDVGDYVAAGLSVHLDGIRNAGVAAAHDPNPTTWADLSPNASHAVFTKRTATDGSGWNEAGNGYFFGGRTYAQMAANLPATPTVTLELFGRFVAADQNDGRTGDYCPNYISGPNDFCVFTFKTGVELRWKTDPYNGSSDASARPYFSPWKGRNFSVAFGLETMVSYEDGVSKASKRRTAVNTIPATRWMIANNQLVVSGSDYSRQAIGTVNAVRVYDRQLSAGEVSWNHKVDAARFEGALAVTNVVVSGKFDNYEGAAAGEYEVFGSHTFTAGAATDEKGKVRPVVGYTIETWDGSAWGEPVPYDGASYTYTEGTSPAKVRLTWKWQPDGMMIIIR